MGRGKTQQPARLPAKLLAVRKYLQLNQEQMVRLVMPDAEDTAIKRAVFSDYEKGRRSPSLLEVLQYAEAIRDLTEHADFNVEDLIDDRRELPWL